jgi:hypothetical protein
MIARFSSDGSVCAAPAMRLDADGGAHRNTMASSHGSVARALDCAAAASFDLAVA